VNIYPFIEAEKSGGHNVSRACALLQVSRAAYYAHRSGPSARQRVDAELTAQIRAAGVLTSPSQPTGARQRSAAATAWSDRQVPA
jgi:hypothetical protein